MSAIRSIIFNFFFFTGSLFWSVALFWALALPKYTCAKVVSSIYGGYISLIERYILGLKLEIKGLENLPTEGPYIIAAKHQSAFETLKLPYMKRLGFPAIILKKELTYIPLWGWYPARMGMVAIDRGSGAKAMKSIIKGCQESVKAGRSVIIFPEGTRTAVGSKKTYKSGIAKIYKDLQIPVVPMALNSGVFWGKNAFFKKAGTVTFEFLPVIPAGRPPLKMVEELERVIEQASDRLVESVKS